jgi:hypothetical protein
VGAAGAGAKGGGAVVDVEVGVIFIGNIFYTVNLLSGCKKTKYRSK